MSSERVPPCSTQKSFPPPPPPPPTATDHAAEERATEKREGLSPFPPLTHANRDPSSEAVFPTEEEEETLRPFLLLFTLILFLLLQYVPQTTATSLYSIRTHRSVCHEGGEGGFYSRFPHTSPPNPPPTTVCRSLSALEANEMEHTPFQERARARREIPPSPN